MNFKIKPQLQNGRLIPVMNTELGDFPQEKWKDIPGFDGYQASNYGRIKSLSRFRYDILGREYLMEERILKITLRNRRKKIGVEVNLRVGNISYSFSVCRLVYEFVCLPG